MLSVLLPNEATVIRFLLSRRGASFTYAKVGATQRPQPVPGFHWDHEVFRLGHGRDMFEAACTALSNWKMFPREMTTLYWPDQPIKVGTVVAVQFRVGPFWSLNPCRIVYTIDECASDSTPARFGFAYGTLPGHMECGEERFLVVWDPQTDEVTYELVVLSRPAHWLSRLGSAVVRREQARFRRLSGRSLQDALAVPVTACS